MIGQLALYGWAFEEPMQARAFAATEAFQMYVEPT